MEFYKNKLINDTIDNHVESWRHTLDTDEFIDPKFLKKIDKYIYKNMMKKFNEVDVFYLLFLEGKGIKLGLFKKLKIYFSGLRPLYDAEKDEIFGMFEETESLDENANYK